MGRDTFHWARLLKAPSNLALNTAREGAATASLGNLCQGLTTLTVKNFFCKSSLNLPFFSLKPSPLILLLQALVKSPSSFLAGPFRYRKAPRKSPRSLLFSRLNSPNSLSFPHRRGAPALGSFLWPPLDPLQQVHVLPVLRAPELDAGLQVGSHHSRGAESPPPP